METCRRHCFAQITWRNLKLRSACCACAFERESGPLYRSVASEGATGVVRAVTDFNMYGLRLSSFPFFSPSRQLSSHFAALQRLHSFNRAFARSILSCARHLSLQSFHFALSCCSPGRLFRLLYLGLSEAATSEPLTSTTGYIYPGRSPGSYPESQLKSSLTSQPIVSDLPSHHHVFDHDQVGPSVLRRLGACGSLRAPK